jgi:hypothetical protein
MRRFLASLSVILAIGAFVAPAPAHAQQSLNLQIGGFVPHGEDGRVDGDVLFNDLDFFLFDLDHFKGGTFGAEWLAALNDRVEVGLGLGIYSKTVDSRYADLVNEDFSEIEQRLKLRIVPFTASFRVLPFGRQAAIQPYVGAGVAVSTWRYTETGDFVDFDGFVFHDRFEGHGTAVGPLILAGVRFPVGQVDIGGEVRHQSGDGDLDPLDFAGGTKIDLGGFSYLATFNVRF